MADVLLKKSKVGQFEKGVFTNRDFKKGEVVIEYKNLKPLTQKEFEALPESEKRFVHSHWGKLYLYPSPARYVNHSSKPNTVQHIEERFDIALRDIKKGEEITTDSTKDDV